MAESKGFDMEAFKAIMHGWIDEMSINLRQENVKLAENLKEDLNNKLGELKQDIEKITENVEELKLENVQLKQNFKQDTIKIVESFEELTLDNVQLK